VENRLNKRREAFVKASNDTLIRDNDQMSDDMIVAEIKAEVAALNSTDAIRAWAAGPIKTVMDGLSARNKAAHGLARDLVDQRWIEVDPPA
jgi:hypothetical protein